MQQYRYGKHPVETSIRQGQVEKVFLHSSFHDHVILELIQQHRIPVERVEESQLFALVMTHHHQGIVSLNKAFSYTLLEPFLLAIATKKDPLLLLLDGLEDPQNLGAIIRTAVGFQVDGIIMKKDRQVEVTPTVAKIASGALEHLPIIQVTNLSQTIERLKKDRFWVVATSLKATEDYRQVDYRGPIALIIGHEGSGISRLVLTHADHQVMIPISNKINSFNASISTAILLAEVQKQRFPL
jgi:23S rRNA (guanosine2251-2'-O)-methyltransferase